MGWLIGQSNGLLIALVCLEYCGLLIAQSELGLSQLCSVFDQLCYSIMLHFLINYASKCTNYASYYDQLFSHKDCQFYKVQFKNGV